MVADPLVMFPPGLIYLVEFFTDKVPGLNWMASILGDFGVVAGLLVTVNYPVLFLVLLIWLFPKLWLWRGIKRVSGTIAKWLAPKEGAPVPPGPAGTRRLWALEAKLPEPDLGQSPVGSNRVICD